MLKQESHRKIEKKDGVWYVNNSILDLIQICGRKALYVLSKPESEQKALALSFGSAIHAGLQHYYSKDTPGSNADLEIMLTAFEAACDDLVKAVPDGEKRSIKNGKQILTHFFETYANEKWKVYTDDHGPFVERKFEVKIADNLFFFGTIDILLQNTETGELCVCDHKTTTSLGTQFATKGDVNHQLTGYVFACQQLGIPVKKAMFQGLQVAKTKCAVMRIFYERSEEQIAEWKNWVYHQVTVWEMMRKTNNYPMNGSGACNQLSGCQYLGVCAAPAQFREQLLNDMNNKTEEAEDV